MKRILTYLFTAIVAVSIASCGPEEPQTDHAASLAGTYSVQENSLIGTSPIASTYFANVTKKGMNLSIAITNGSKTLLPQTTFQYEELAKGQTGNSTNGSYTLQNGNIQVVFTIKDKKYSIEVTGKEYVFNGAKGAKAKAPETATLLGGEDFNTTLKKALTDVTSITFETESIEKCPEGAIILSKSGSKATAWISKEDKAIIVKTNADKFTATSCKKMFSGLAKLENVVFGKAFDISNVTDMSYMFEGCAALQEFDSKKLAEIKEPETETKADMPQPMTAESGSFDTSKVANMSFMFSGCVSLSNIDLTIFNTSSLTIIDGMFANCTNVTNIVFGKDFTLDNVTSYSGVFDNLAKEQTECLIHFLNKETQKIVMEIWELLTDAKYEITNSEANTRALLLDGPTFKTILNENINNEESIIFRTNVTEPMPKDAILLSTADSKYPAWLSISNNTIYINTAAEEFLANADCSKMFASLQYLSTEATRPRTIKTINLGNNFNTSKVENMRQMFYSLGNCENLYFGEAFDTSNVTDMYWMFMHGNNIKSLDLSGFNTSKVTNMRGMFAYLWKLESLDVSKFDTSNVTNMAAMFSEIPTTPDLSNFDTSNVTDMNSMFNRCSGLTSLDLSNFNTSNVEDMRYMFHNCSSLSSLDLSNFNTSNVENMGYMFYNCSSLTSLDLSNFNTSNVEDMRYMFHNCSSLSSLDLSNFNTSNVENMGYMFYNCSSLTSLDLSNFNTSKVTDMQRMFVNCSGLSSLDLSNFNTSNVKNMGVMFHGCSGLTSLDLSNFNTSNVTMMGHMFYGCSGLTSLDLSNFVFAFAWISMDSMFEGCSKIESIKFPNTQRLYCPSMSKVFKDCSNLTSLQLPSGITIGYENGNGSLAELFSGCSSLTSLDLHFITSDVISMAKMFDGCSKLQEIAFGLNFSLNSIHEGELGEMFNEMKTSGVTIKTYGDSTWSDLIEKGGAQPAPNWTWIDLSKTSMAARP